jgi:hypothetical protein
MKSPTPDTSTVAESQPLVKVNNNIMDSSKTLQALHDAVDELAQGHVPTANTLRLVLQPYLDLCQQHATVPVRAVADAFKIVEYFSDGGGMRLHGAAVLDHLCLSVDVPVTVGSTSDADGDAVLQLPSDVSIEQLRTRLTQTVNAVFTTSTLEAIIDNGLCTTIQRARQRLLREMFNERISAPQCDLVAVFEWCFKRVFENDAINNAFTAFASVQCISPTDQNAIKLLAALALMRYEPVVHQLKQVAESSDKAMRARLEKAVPSQSTTTTTTTTTSTTPTPESTEPAAPSEETTSVPHTDTAALEGDLELQEDHTMLYLVFMAEPVHVIHLLIAAGVIKTTTTTTTTTTTSSTATPAVNSPIDDKNNVAVVS